MLSTTAYSTETRKQIQHASIQWCEVLVRRWLPGGRLDGNEYTVLNPTRDDKTKGSFRINVASGAWADFAVDGMRGQSPVSLYQHLNQVNREEAIEEIGRQLGMIDGSGIKPDFSGLLASVKNGNGKDAADMDENECVMPVPEEAGDAPIQRGETGRWPYWNRDGKLLGYVLRFDPPGKRKWYSPITFWRRGGWKLKHWPSPKPLYGLDLLAARPDDPVLVVEGEKTCDAARRHFGERYVCVAWPGGAEAADQAFWEPLRDRDTLLLPDNDNGGFKGMRKAGECLIRALAKSIIVIDALPEETPVKWDVADAESLGLEWLDGLSRSAVKDERNERNERAPARRAEPKKREIPVQRVEPWPTPMLAQLERELSGRVDFPHPLASHYAALAVASHLCARRYVGPAMEPCSLYTLLILPGPMIQAAYRNAIVDALRAMAADADENLHSVNAGRIQSEAQINDLLGVKPRSLHLLANFDSSVRLAQQQHSGAILHGIQHLLDLYSCGSPKLEIAVNKKPKCAISMRPTVNAVAFSTERRFLETLGHLDEGGAFQAVWIDDRRMEEPRWVPVQPISDDLVRYAGRLWPKNLLETVWDDEPVIRCQAGDLSAIGRAGHAVLKMTGNPAKARAAVVAMRRLAVVLAAWNDPDAPHIDERLAQWVVEHEMDRIKVEHEVMKGKGGDGEAGVYEKVLRVIETRAGDGGIRKTDIGKWCRPFNRLSSDEQDDLVLKMVDDEVIACKEGHRECMILFPVDFSQRD
jgi:hypothetical protein